MVDPRADSLFVTPRGRVRTSAPQDRLVLAFGEPRWRVLKRGKKLAGHHHHHHHHQQHVTCASQKSAPQQLHGHNINVNMSTHPYQHVQLYILNHVKYVSVVHSVFHLIGMMTPPLRWTARFSAVKVLRWWIKGTSSKKATTTKSQVRSICFLKSRNLWGYLCVIYIYYKRWITSISQILGVDQKKWNIKCMCKSAFPACSWQTSSAMAYSCVQWGPHGELGASSNFHGKPAFGSRWEATTKI